MSCATLVLVAPGAAATTFTNAGPITVEDANGPVRAASPYPSDITVSGLSQKVAKVSVTLRGLSHGFPQDIDVLLVSPSGTAATILSDEGGGSPGIAAPGVDLTLDDDAATAVPHDAAFATGAFRPANASPADSFPAPAPAGVSAAPELSQFVGDFANGSWSLYVVDDSHADTGSIAGGWSIDVVAAAPAATTAAASATSPTATTLNGSIDTEQSGTVYHFEYGPTTAYGTLTQNKTLPRAGTPTPVSAPLSGLTPNTRYHYRIVATNANGSSHSDDATVVTAPLPPAVATGMARDVGATSATLTGSVDNHGGAATYVFEYGDSTAYGRSTAPAGFAAAAGPVEVSAAVPGLAPATVYHFRVSAMNGGGTTSGDDQVLTTAPSPMAPVVPTPTPMPTPTPSASPSAPFTAVLRAPRRQSRRVRARVRLSAGATVTGRLVARRGRRVGRLRRRELPAGTTRLRFTLDAMLARRLAVGGTVRVRMVVDALPTGGGQAVRLRRAIRLRPAG